MYARMLVGAVAMVGDWWLEERQPTRRVVAAHVVNLLWNGLRHLDPTPAPLTRTDETPPPERRGAPS